MFRGLLQQALYGKQACKRSSRSSLTLWYTVASEVYNNLIIKKILWFHTEPEGLLQFSNTHKWNLALASLIQPPDPNTLKSGVQLSSWTYFSVKRIHRAW
jgi:hypothetical protein